MNPTPESRVGEIATRYPLATRVFARHGIDFCCGGGIGGTAVILANRMISRIFSTEMP